MSVENRFRFPDTGQVRCYDREGNEIKPAPGDPLWGRNGCYATNPPAFKKLDERGRVLEDAAGWADAVFASVLVQFVRLVRPTRPALANGAPASIPLPSR
jgi:hypothetical protein